MRYQNAQIIHALVGPTELFVEVLCKPPQHNEHCKGWRYHQFLADCKIREANVREAARQIIAQCNARNEAQYAQAAE